MRFESCSFPTIICVWVRKKILSGVWNMEYMTIIPAKWIFGSHCLVCMNIRLVCINIRLVGRIGTKQIAGHGDSVPNYLTMTKIICLAIIQWGEVNLLNLWRTLADLLVDHFSILCLFFCNREIILYLYLSGTYSSNWPVVLIALAIARLTSSIAYSYQFLCCEYTEYLNYVDNLIDNCDHCRKL